MARSISVKVPTASLIADIESALVQIDKDIEEYPAARIAYEVQLESYNDLVRQTVIDFVRTNPNLVKVDTLWQDRHALIVPSALLSLPPKPECPEQPNQHQSFGREWTTRKALLERNLKVLKMTTQEEVNASTYGAIIELL